MSPKTPEVGYFVQLALQKSVEEEIAEIDAEALDTCPDTEAMLAMFSVDKEAVTIIQGKTSIPGINRYDLAIDYTQSTISEQKAQALHDAYQALCAYCSPFLRVSVKRINQAIDHWLKTFAQYSDIELSLPLQSKTDILH